MNFHEQKRAAIAGILWLTEEDDWVLKAISRLLNIYEYDYELSEEQKRILDERMAEYEANPQNVIPWEDVKKELMNRKQE